MHKLSLTHTQTHTHKHTRTHTHTHTHTQAHTNTLNFCTYKTHLYIYLHFTLTYKKCHLCTHIGLIQKPNY